MGVGQSTFVVYIGNPWRVCPNVKIFLNAERTAREINTTDLRDGWFIWSQSTDNITFTVTTSEGPTRFVLSRRNYEVGVWELTLDPSTCTKPDFRPIGAYPNSGNCVKPDINSVYTFIVDFSDADPNVPILFNVPGFGGQINFANLYKGAVFRWCEIAFDAGLGGVDITFTINGQRYTLNQGGYKYRIINGRPEFMHITPMQPSSLGGAAPLPSVSDVPQPIGDGNWLIWLIGALLILAIIILIVRSLPQWNINVQQIWYLQGSE